jgi:predicted SprT family Zn-dependent metalloprotease
VKIREKSWLKQLKVAISTRGKRARRVKSTKFVKQILSTYVRFLVNSELEKNPQALQEVQHQDRTLTSQSALKFFMQNGKVGGG